MYTYMLEIKIEKLNISIAKNKSSNSGHTNYRHHIYNEEYVFFPKRVHEVSGVLYASVSPRRLAS